MLDVVGRRRWYFLFSAIITLPGLLFIILTPVFGVWWWLVGVPEKIATALWSGDEQDEA